MKTNRLFKTTTLSIAIIGMVITGCQKENIFPGNVAAPQISAKHDSLGIKIQAAGGKAIGMTSGGGNKGFPPPIYVANSIITVTNSNNAKHDSLGIKSQAQGGKSIGMTSNGHGLAIQSYEQNSSATGANTGGAAKHDSIIILQQHIGPNGKPYIGMTSGGGNKN